MAEQDEREARFQEFINQPPRSPGARLRDAFAELLARGSDQAIPLEKLAAMQALAREQQQPPDPTITRPREMGDSMTTDLPMRWFQPDPTLDFPQAMGGQRNTDNPWRTENPAPAPFGGKGEVIGPYPKPYELPKKNKKKDKG